MESCRLHSLNTFRDIDHDVVLKDLANNYSPILWLILRNVIGCANHKQKGESLEEQILMRANNIEIEVFVDTFNLY